MVFFLVYFKADLENVTNLQPLGGCDDPDHTYYFKLKCEHCGEVSKKETCIAMSETVLGPSSRETYNLVQKCKLCGREGTVQMIPGQGRPLILELSKLGGLGRLMVFDFKGLEPIEFSFLGRWKAEKVGGTEFDVDFSEGDFADYDENGECPVSISNLKVRFRVVRKIKRWDRTVYN